MKKENKLKIKVLDIIKQKRVNVQSLFESWGINYEQELTEDELKLFEKVLK